MLAPWVIVLGLSCVDGCGRMVVIGKRRSAPHVWARGLMNLVRCGLLVPVVPFELPGVGRDARERRVSVHRNVRLMLSRVA